MQSHINTINQSYGQHSALADVLIIEINDSQLLFCEYESTSNTPHAIFTFPIDDALKSTASEQLIHALNHFKIIHTKYIRVLIHYFNSQFTLCPTNYYNEQQARTLLEFNVGNVENKIVVCDDVKSDIKLIYAIDEELKSTLDKLFPQHQLNHSLTLLSKLLLNAEELQKTDILFVINTNYIEVCLKQNNQLQLANQYSITTSEDVLYYILFILEQYQLNPLTVSISLAGNIISNDGLIASLKKYVKNIRLVTGHKSISWNQLVGLPQHFNYTLLNHIFCA